MATNRLLTHQEFKLANPARIVLDFPNTKNRVPFTQLSSQAAPVKKIRVQQFKPDPAPVARVVLELEEGNEAHQTTADKSAVRLVFHRAKAEPITSKTPRNAETAIKGSFIPTASAAPVEKNPAKAAATIGIVPQNCRSCFAGARSIGCHQCNVRCSQAEPGKCRLR
jgi:hypothetical protein